MRNSLFRVKVGSTVFIDDLPLHYAESEKFLMYGDKADCTLPESILWDADAEEPDVWVLHMEDAIESADFVQVFALLKTFPADGFHFRTAKGKRRFQKKILFALADCEDLNIVAGVLAKVPLDLELRDSYGATIMEIAQANGNFRMVQLLLKFGALPTLCEAEE